MVNVQLYALFAMRYRLCAWVSTVVLLVAWGGHADALELRTFESEHYRVHTTLEVDEARAYAAHMDRVLEALVAHFAYLEPRIDEPLPLYLLSSHDEFLVFLQEHAGITAPHSDGMFITEGGREDLVTFAGDRSRSRTLAVLQHEGFHQFAWRAIGPTLPIWLNEGLAQYFEDAVLIDGALQVGLVDAQRIEQLREAVRQRRAVTWELLHGISAAQWGEIVHTNPDAAAVLYAQSWSIVYYLLHEADEDEQSALLDMLQRLSQGEHAASAFDMAFAGQDVGELEQAWIDFALAHEPDPLNIALPRMEFVAQAMQFLIAQDEPIPNHIVQLRATLRREGYAMMRQFYGSHTTWDAREFENFMYVDEQGERHRLHLLRGQGDLPPRITAPRLDPRPELIWSRDANGELHYEITFE